MSNTTTNPVVRQALRTANLISAVKVTLVVLNIAFSLALMVGGVLSKPSGITPVIREDGYAYSSGPSDGTALWFALVLAGAALAIVGTLLILAILGWFEDMLRTNTETTMIFWMISETEDPSTSPGPVAPKIQTAPMNQPLASDR